MDPSSPLLHQSVDSLTSVSISANIRKLSASLPSHASLQFWGRLQGSHHDYYLLVSLQHEVNAHPYPTPLIKKSFYFSIDNGITFALLPSASSLSADVRAACASIIDNTNGGVLLDGNPQRRVKWKRLERKAKGADSEEADAEKAEEEDDEDGGEDVPSGKVPSPSSIREMDYLVFLIDSIDFDCSLLPKGALTLTASGSVVQSSPSVSPSAIPSPPSLFSFAHYRTPTTHTAAIRLRSRMGDVANDDFLDWIDGSEEGNKSGGGLEDRHGGLEKEMKEAATFNVHVEENGYVCHVRSLQWLGYEMVYDTEKKSWYQGYMGNGRKNNLVKFMV